MEDRRTPDDLPAGEREIAIEADEAKDSLSEELTPLEEAQLRRELALEFEQFQGGMEG